MYIHKDNTIAYIKSSRSYYENDERLDSANVANYINTEIAIVNLYKHKKLPKFISELNNITSLRIHMPKLTQFGKDIVKLKNLKELDLRCDELEDFPKFIHNMPSLKTLKLFVNKMNFSKISNVPIDTLELDIRHNNVIIDLPDLKSLYINYMKYDAQLNDDYFTTMPNLNYLCLCMYDKDFDFKLPSSLKVLRLNWCNVPNFKIGENNLNKLEISKCNLSTICTENLENIEQISIFGNKIIDFTGKFDKLTNLYLDENLIEYFEIEAPNLTLLSVTKNKLQQFPLSITNLTKLEVLDLSCNEIKKIPHEINNLQQLKSLYINEMIGITFPFTFTELINLKIFEYDGEINIIIREFLNRNISRINRVINDEQNTHDSEVQNHLTNSLKNLMKNDIIVKDIYKYISKEKIISSEAIKIVLRNFRAYDTHMITNLTYKDIFILVINEAETICKNDDEKLKEIKNILNDEIIRSKELCFTGNINNLINSLNGFSDNVAINIQNSEIIYGIVMANIKDGKDKIIDELKKQGYSEQTIKDWTNDID